MALTNSLIFESLPTSGLANQLRGLTSAILLAQDLEREFHLSWNKHQDMPDTTLSDLFAEPTLPFTQIAGESFSWLQRRRFVRRDREIAGLFDRIQKILYRHHQFNALGIDMMAKAIRAAEPLLVISSYYSYSHQATSDLQFYRRRHELYKRFIPVPEVKQAVDSFIADSFAPHTIGIHLRTGISMRNASEGIVDANHFWPRGIPFPLFFELIDDEIRSHPETRIFLATDNTLESAPIADRYGERVVMYPQNTDGGMVGRSALTDQKGALIDLYLLSRCQKLIGTYNSTFSYEAAVIGDVPFVEMSPSGLRQNQDLGNGKTVIIDFRDRTLRPLGHIWIKNDSVSPKKASSAPGQKPSTEDFYNELMQLDTPVVLDCNAGTGGYSLLAKYAPQGLIYAFQPDSELAELLMSNIKLNNLESRIVIVMPKAVAGETTQSIPAQSIDELAETEALEQVDLIRLKLEQPATNQIKGGARTIARFLPRIWIERPQESRSHPDGAQDLIDALPDPKAYQVRTTESGDYLCVPVRVGS